MAASKGRTNQTKRKGAPARTPEAREKQLIALSMDLAEEQILNGTVSAQVLAHFVKLGSNQAQLEREKLVNENKLLKAKTEALESAKKVEELYSEALRAMRSYSGRTEEVDSEDDFEE